MRRLSLPEIVECPNTLANSDFDRAVLSSEAKIREAIDSSPDSSPDWGSTSGVVFFEATGSTEADWRVNVARTPPELDSKVGVGRPAYLQAWVILASLKTKLDFTFIPIDGKSAFIRLIVPFGKVVCSRLGWLGNEIILG